MKKLIILLLSLTIILITAQPICAEETRQSKLLKIESNLKNLHKIKENIETQIKKDPSYSKINPEKLNDKKFEVNSTNYSYNQVTAEIDKLNLEYFKILGTPLKLKEPKFMELSTPANK